MRDENKSKIIAVDFDGTLVQDNYPNIGIGRYWIIEFVKTLRAQGHRIILWTCRSGKYLDEALAWCSSMGIEFDAVNANLPESIAKYGNDSRKITFDYCLDNQAISVTELADRLGIAV